MKGVTALISGHDGKITLEVSGYERPDAGSACDKNWLFGNVRINVGPFSAVYEARFETYDFASFYAELKDVLDAFNGTAHFECAEGWLTLAISMGTRGTVSVRGVAKSLDSLGTTLNFSFNSDQSYLSQTLDSLRILGNQFPVLK